MIFDNFNSVNIVNSVGLQERILVIKNICFLGLIYHGLHVCYERLQQQLEEVKEVGGS